MPISAHTSVSKYSLRQCCKHSTDSKWVLCIGPMKNLIHVLDISNCLNYTNKQSISTCMQRCDLVEQNSNTFDRNLILSLITYVN